jgi:energy-coupling factor transport system permease protein
MKRPTLDPRTKLLLLGAAATGLMALDRWQDLLIACGALAGLTFLLRQGRPWFSFLKGLAFPGASFLAIAWAAFDLATGLCALLRLASMGTAIFLFFRSTAPEALSNALIGMGVPYALTFVLTASMQFVQVLTRRARLIRDAQRARGIPLDTGLSILRHWPALAGPLLIQAFKLADELAEALEARGFGAPARRFREEPRFRRVDWAVALAGIAGLVLLLRLR